MTTYFYVLTINTGTHTISFTNTTEFPEESTEETRYNTVYEAVCERLRSEGYYVPEKAPVVFWSCKPN